MTDLLNDSLSPPGGDSRTLPRVFGTDSRTTLADGRDVRVVQLNNAATTPPFERTLRETEQFLGAYGALHRGAGPRARATVEAVEQALGRIQRFIGQPADNGLLFCANTSAAINQLARLLPLSTEDVVLTSEIEHTSNNLPWRYNTQARVVDVRADDSGALDLEHLDELLAAHAGRVRLLAVTGASNLTGFCPDLRGLADRVHAAGALLFVDAAQLAPHRRIDMAESGVDALAFSAHKVYAPFGLGVLSVPRHVLDRAPADPGGGSIDMITDSGSVLWSPSAERHQTGTWNATGIVALGASCAELLDAGWDVVEGHERALVRYAAAELATVSGIRMTVPAERYLTDDRIGTFPFLVPGQHHAKVAAVLEHEHGIEVRAGTICNHRLVRRWLAVPDDEQARIEAEIEAGDRLASYGIVRASLACHSSVDDVDRLVEALRSITTEGPRLEYRAVPEHETYEPA
ncbi:aminotransferase class V-fold PLP-dependent enzyme [Pseudonocardia spinosispora]|uniref:aminotransferase class V-fold PLP-dependent enzyme n=1 Tax=Pseudonocardia spinosispora TaxID=103441 RepID=UPI0004222F7F|nr:aminotransferase class V-fold PLP-dependent enzyme [Pseudonocardia spinosispora]